MDDRENRNDAHEGDLGHDDLSPAAVAVLEPSRNHVAVAPDPPAAPTISKKVGGRKPGELKPPLSMFAGAIFGLISAVLYTLANIALRSCVAIDPFLVSAVKAAPTVIVLAPFLMWMFFRGETIATNRRIIPRFMGAALLGQFVGNAAFQMALGMIGLAVAVPITLGTMIIGGAVLGRVILHEPVRLHTGVAMLVLIASVVVLSLPKEWMMATSDATLDAASGVDATGSSRIWIGSLCAAASGAAYSLFGVVMRQALTGGLSAPLTMFISGAVGTISLWSVTFLRLGFSSLGQVEAADWFLMAGAGMFNFTAFVALSASLKSLPVVAVNLINASQVAMAAVAGILLFAEPLTGTLIIGIGLTFAGLTILAGRRRPAV